MQKTPEGTIKVSLVLNDECITIEFEPKNISKFIDGDMFYPADADENRMDLKVSGAEVFIRFTNEEVEQFKKLLP